MNVERAAVVRKLGPDRWILELLTPMQPNRAYYYEIVRGPWIIEFYLEFDNWDEAVARAVQWRLEGKVDGIIYDDRDEK